MTLRFARHTNNLEIIRKFYTEILGLAFLGEFKAHNSYDGIFLGIKNTDWHLEFTTSPDLAKHQFDEDDLLVFYPDTTAEYKELLANLEKHKIKIINPKNPYWRANGIMCHDPDGYRIVISPLKLKTSRKKNKITSTQQRAKTPK